MTLDQYDLLYRSDGRPPDRYVAGVLHATTQGDLTAFTVLTPYGPNEAIARGLVGDLRARTGPLAPPTGFSVLVGGGAADVEDVVTGIAAEFPRTAMFILVTTYLVLLLLLRSLILPLKALAMNSLSILASFGALVWIFQDGNLSMLFGTRPLGLRRDHPAGDPVLRPVRPVDGLRGVPAHPHARELGGDRTTTRRRSPTASSGAAGS